MWLTFLTLKFNFDDITLIKKKEDCLKILLKTDINLQDKTKSTEKEIHFTITAKSSIPGNQYNPLH